jgi:uroporphyrinogen decarboxylase
MILDDIVGFLREEDFVEFALPYLAELFSPDVRVKFFHNDAPCAQSIGHYPGAGINLYNPGVHTPLDELRSLSAGRLAILGTIPPRDVLALGTPADVHRAVRELLERTPDRSRLILSCSGGMPPEVPAENIKAFVAEARAASADPPSRTHRG